MQNSQQYKLDSHYVPMSVKNARLEHCEKCKSKSKCQIRYKVHYISCPDIKVVKCPINKW